MRKKKKKKKKWEAQKKPLVDKAQRTICEPICVGMERRRCEGERQKEDVKEKGRKRNKTPRARQRSGRWLSLLLNLMQNSFCVDAAAGWTWMAKGQKKELTVLK